MFKIMINREKCKGRECGLCVRVCPSNWRILDDNKAHVVKFKIKKLGCNEKAMKVCPFGAIRVVEI
jgi:ferredoxin